MFAVSMPKLDDGLGVRRDRDEVPGDRRLVAAARRCTSRARVCAFVSVSSVLNVFDEMMNSVSAGSRSRVASAKSLLSTFETNRIVSPRSE